MYLGVGYQDDKEDVAVDSVSSCSWFSKAAQLEVQAMNILTKLAIAIHRGCALFILLTVLILAYKDTDPEMYRHIYKGKW